MKRPNIIEEIKRFHEISGNKNVISEDFLDDLLKKIGLKGDEKDTKKIDDPKKADLVSDDVKQFYSTLENVKSDLNQQSAGNYKFQKDVESIQIGLMILGYDLPKHGVDGKYGPETASAISKFKKENNLDKKSEPITESILVSILEDFELIREKLEMIQLDDTSYPNVKFDKDGTQYDEVNKALLDDLQKAAESVGIIATITTAKSGHGALTTTGKPSRHMTQTAVDIAMLDGEGSGKASNETNGNPTFREKGILLKDALVQLGYTWNSESGNDKAVLWQTNTGGNHFNHLHISNQSGASTAELSSLASGTGSVMTPEDVKVLLDKLKQKGVTSEDLKKYIDVVKTGGGAEFTDIDIMTNEGFQAYSEICQKFIDSRQPNPLGITGDMMATGAKTAYERYQRYVPAELALSQLALEGGIGNKDLNSRPIRTKNPFNVGNTDDGSNVQQNDVQDGINAYYNLIARDYIGKGKTAKDLLVNFVNKSGNRYATAKGYESSLNTLAAQANRIAKPITDRLATTKPEGSDVA